MAGVRADGEGGHLSNDNLLKPAIGICRVTPGAVVVMEGDTLLGVTSTGEEERVLHRAQNRLPTETALSSLIKAATALH